MNKLITIRHAESVANTNGIYQGQTYDTPLSELGEKQAKAVANEFKGMSIDQIIASPLKRTMQTAQAISDACGEKVTTSREILETNHGEWEGHDVNWIKKYFPHELKQWQSSPSEVQFPSGEAFSEVDERVGKFLMNREWTGTTVIVTHDNIVRLMICLAQDVSIDDMWDIDLDPAGITEFEMLGVNGTKELLLTAFNKVDHLEGLKSDLSMHAL